MISVYPLEDDGNVVHEDLLYNFINRLFSGEGGLFSTDLNVFREFGNVGIAIVVAPGGAIVSYDSVFGGKRIFFNSAESNSGPNKHPNPGFDTATTHWSVVGGGTLVRDTGTFHIAPASGKITTSGAAAYNQGIKTADASCRVNSLELQEVSCWVNAPIGTSVKLKITEFNSGGTAGVTYESISVGTGAWTKIIVGFTTADTCKFVNSEIQISSTGTVSVFVDDFSVNQSQEWIQGLDIADPTNPRVDRVVAVIQDKWISGGGDIVSGGKFRVISGTPTVGATLVNLSGAAAVPSNCFLLANVLVPAAAASLVGGNIDNTVRLVVKLDFTEIPYVPPGAFPGEFVWTESIAGPAGAYVANEARFTIFKVDREIVVSSIRFKAGVGSGNMDVGIYTDNVGPASLLWSDGSFTAPSGVETRLISGGSPTTLTLPPGVYWFAAVFDNATATMTGNVPDFGLTGYLKAASFPLPASISSPVANSTVRSPHALIRS